MAQPKEAPLSVRLGDERLSEVDAWAKRQNISRHAAVLALVDGGLRVGKAPQPESLQATFRRAAGDLLKSPAVPYGSRLKKR